MKKNCILLLIITTHYLTAHSQGYHFSDPYCEVTDAVYLSDIDEALGKK